MYAQFCLTDTNILFCSKLKCTAHNKNPNEKLSKAKIAPV